ncbi:MAG: YaiI/YqxD family protein [Clostridia bacterium]
MRLFIDADACPVTNLAIALANERGVEVVLVCDDAHVMHREGAQTVMVARGADSADFTLVNLLKKGDVAVTQDYGLAAMCLSRGARVLNQDGREYDESNIDSLLGIRHLSRKIRMAGGRTKGPPKRLKEQDEWFRAALEKILTVR